MTKNTAPAVTGLTVESMYNAYISECYQVNRRYQRKLVWTNEEKESLIDSIIRGYPIPLFLFADTKSTDGQTLEVIDGMQRMNAIISFIENKISHNGKYFDLNTLSATKARADDHALEQRHPTYDRSVCLGLTQYIMPATTYTFDDTDKVDQVFKRINSMGKHLSRQELRVAGATGQLAALVRKISANVRGDSSQSDIFGLDKMPYISLAFRDGDPGIKVSNVVWIKHGIITKEMLREAKDEEIICDILASVALTAMPASNTDFFNQLYGYPDPTPKSSEINAAVSRIGANVLQGHIEESFDQFEQLFKSIGSTFTSHCFTNQPARAPRYFTALMIAIDKLAHEQGKIIHDLVGLKKALKNSCDGLSVGTGGNWSSANKERCVNSLIGIISPYCKGVNSVDPTALNWSSRVENLITQSLIEGQLYDFKIGFTTLDENAKWSSDLVSKILETLVAMANHGPGHTGYVIIGIADCEEDAARVHNLYDVTPTERCGRYIVGVDHSCKALGLTPDQLFTKLAQEFDGLPVDPSVIRDVKASMKLASYYGKSIVILNLKAGSRPRLYNEQYVVREGTSNRALAMQEVSWLFERFSGGR